MMALAKGYWMTTYPLLFHRPCTDYDPGGHGHIIRALADPNGGAEGKAAHKAWIGDTREVGREECTREGERTGFLKREWTIDGRQTEDSCLTVPRLPACLDIFLPSYLHLRAGWGFSREVMVISSTSPHLLPKTPNSGFKFRGSSKH